MKYLEIAEALERECRTLPPAGRLPSERQLAERFAVARPTLRRALEELENRDAAHRRGRSGWFAGPPSGRLPRLVWCGIAAPPPELAAAARSWELEWRHPEIARTAGFGGDVIVLAGAGISVELAANAAASGKTVILFDDELPERFAAGFDRLRLDWFEWGRRAGRLLARRGCRRPALLRFAGISADAAAGFRLALAEEKVRCEEDLLLELAADTLTAGVNGALQLLEFGSPDGIAVAGDFLPAGAALALAQSTPDAYVPMASAARPAGLELELYPFFTLSFSNARIAGRLTRMIRARLRHPGGARESVLLPPFCGKCALD